MHLPLGVIHELKRKQSKSLLASRGVRLTLARLLFRKKENPSHLTCVSFLYPPPLLPAAVSQEALRVPHQLRVPQVGGGGEAGRLPSAGEGERLRGRLRGELRGGRRVLGGEEVLLQRLRSHLPGAQEPLQR